MSNRFISSWRRVAPCRIVLRVRLTCPTMSNDSALRLVMKSKKVQIKTSQPAVRIRPSPVAHLEEMICRTESVDLAGYAGILYASQNASTIAKSTMSIKLERLGAAGFLGGLGNVDSYSITILGMSVGTACLLTGTLYALKGGYGIKIAVIQPNLRSPLVLADLALNGYLLGLGALTVFSLGSWGFATKYFRRSSWLLSLKRRKGAAMHDPRFLANPDGIGERVWVFQPPVPPERPRFAREVADIAPPMHYWMLNLASVHSCSWIFLSLHTLVIIAGLIVNLTVNWKGKIHLEYGTAILRTVPGFDTLVALCSIASVGTAIFLSLFMEKGVHTVWLSRILSADAFSPRTTWMMVRAVGRYRAEEFGRPGSSAALWPHPLMHGTGEGCAATPREVEAAELVKPLP